jgi:hypothetical protein
MNEIFNIQRFGRVVKAETLAFRRYYLIYAIFAASYALAVYLLKRDGFYPEGFGRIAVVLFIIAPFLLYGNVFHRIKGVNYTLLPASNFEKWLAFWFQNVIIVPFILGLFWLTMSGLEYLLFGRPISMYIGTHEIQTLLVGVLGMQAVAMVGTMAFRRLKWMKTFGVIFLLQVVTLIITNLLMYRFDLKTFIIEIQMANLDPHAYSWLIDYIKVVAYIIFPFGLWLVSFFKLQEQEL